MIWAAATLIAAALQTARNAAQAGLDRQIGVAGASSVRFIFGLPVALICLAVIATRAEIPPIRGDTLRWATFGAVAQIAATALMLMTMRRRGFGVATALLKTEPVTLVLIGALLLSDPLSLPQLAAISVTVGGVILLSGADWSRADLRAVATGITAGALFGLSAIGFRGAILTLPGEGFVVKAALVLCITLAIQTVLCVVFLAMTDRAALAGMRREARVSALAGAVGAVASLFWFMAFALTTAANVRSLALIEVVFAQFVSGRIFQQQTRPRQIAGMGLMICGIVALLRLA